MARGIHVYLTQEELSGFDELCDAAGVARQDGLGDEESWRLADKFCHKICEARWNSRKRK